MLAGCAKRIDSVYGERKRRAPKSVNGTAVLGEMFEAEGHEVYSWHLLSPRIRDRADCIVWFPDDFKPPSEEVRNWLEDWLLEKSGRTLIYVGRDFDAAGWYWDKVKPGAPPEQAKLIAEAAAAAKDDFDILRHAVPANEDCGWFIVEGKDRPRKVRTLTGGDPEWRKDIDPSKLEIELRSRIIPSPSAEVLLQSEDDVLVTREMWEASWADDSFWDSDPWAESQSGDDLSGKSRLIVVANGSFLLNLPLVNHEHRKLAGKLIEEIGPPEKFVVFLESGEGGPEIRDEDPSAEVPTGLEILLISPTDWVLWHFIVVGIVFCFSRWPIFGLPRDLRRDSTSDFGKHIWALAELLQRSRDRAYALGRLAHYQQTAGSRLTDSD